MTTTKTAKANGTSGAARKRLTREQVTGAKLALQEDEVDLPELGGTILVRQLSAGMRTRLLEGIVDTDTGDILDLALFQARLFGASVIDPDLSEEEAVALLDEWPAAVWDRVMAAVNAMTPNPQEVERAAAQEFRGSKN
jgi:hypothetical protein